MNSTAAAASSTSAPSAVSSLDAPTLICSLIPSLFTGQDDSFVDEEHRTKAIPDPDIAGIGVISAFLITAYAVFIWMLAAYFCGWLPPSLLGNADIKIFKRSRTNKIRPWLQEAIDKAILGYADQQIIYGCSILIAGFIQWRTISVYHYHVVMYLAWMSSNTHLSAVTLLLGKYYGADGLVVNDKAKQHIVKILRLTGMLVVAIMLIVALVPTTKQIWFLTIFNGDDLPAKMPAYCFWWSKYTGTFEKDSLWSFLIVIISCVFTGAQLFGLKKQANELESKLLCGIARQIDHVLEKLEKNRHRNWLLVRYKVTVNLYTLIWFVSEVSKSVMVSLWMCGAGLIWGSRKLLWVRESIGAHILKDENIWGFGQILALLLLTIPMIAFLETAIDEKYKDGRADSEAPLGGPKLPARVELSKRIHPTHTASSFSNDEDIYKYRFTKGLFWVAQLCAAWIVFLFDFLYYYELRYDFGYIKNSYMVIIGAAGTLVVISLWFLGGMVFSGLFKPKGIDYVATLLGTGSTEKLQ